MPGLDLSEWSVIPEDERPMGPVYGDARNAYSLILGTEDILPVRGASKDLSEVQNTLLGTIRREVSQRQLELVNTYGINPKEFSISDISYTYSQDPIAQWAGHIPGVDVPYRVAFAPVESESAVQVVAFPPPLSFDWGSSAGKPPIYPGPPQSDGVMLIAAGTNRFFRFQPGRPNIFTMGVRASNSGATPRCTRRWGIANSFGDQLHLELTGNSLLEIVRVNAFDGEERLSQSEWNGRLGQTSWVLDPSKVTMWRFEVAGDGTYNSKISAYLPDGYGEARWVKLHQFTLDNSSATPGFRSPFFRLSFRVVAYAGCTQRQFVNLYGCSVYTDGADGATPATGATFAEAKPIDSARSRTIVGIGLRPFIASSSGDLIENQKAIYPTSLTITSTVDAIFSLLPPRLSFFNNFKYPATFGFTFGRVISCPTASPVFSVAVSADRDVLTLSSGDYAAITAAESDPARPFFNIKVERNDGGLPLINHTYVQQKTGGGLGANQIRLTRPLPAGYSGTLSLRFNRFTGVARSVQALRTVVGGITTNGPDQGRLYYLFGPGLWRIGLWADTGAAYDQSQVAWFNYSTTRINQAGGAEGPELVLRPADFGTYDDPRMIWRIEPVSSTDPTPQLRARCGGLDSVVLPLPTSYSLRVVAELRSGAEINSLIADNGATLTRPRAFSLQPPPPGPRPFEADASIIDSPVLVGLTWSGTNFTTTEPAGGAVVPTTMQPPQGQRLAGAVVDVAGTGELIDPGAPIHSWPCNAGVPITLDLRRYCGLEKAFIQGSPEISSLISGPLFITGRARQTGQSGTVDVSLNWEESS